VPERSERLFEMLLQQKPGMIGADRDTHRRRIVLRGSALDFRLWTLGTHACMHDTNF
jgi:hypothetical protein